MSDERDIGKMSLRLLETGREKKPEEPDTPTVAVPVPLARDLIEYFTLRSWAAENVGERLVRGESLAPILTKVFAATHRLQALTKNLNSGPQGQQLHHLLHVLFPEHGDCTAKKSDA